MVAQSEIRKMPTVEKVALLEMVWDDLRGDSDALEIPQWHKDVLDERAEAVRRGEASYIDWKDAKQQIATATR